MTALSTATRPHSDGTAMPQLSHKEVLFLNGSSPASGTPSIISVLIFNAQTNPGAASISARPALHQQISAANTLLQEHLQQEQLAQAAFSISCTRHHTHKQGTQRKNRDPSKTTSFLLKAAEDEDTQVSGLERGYKAEGPQGTEQLLAHGTHCQHLPRSHQQ